MTGFPASLPVCHIKRSYEYTPETNRRYGHTPSLGTRCSVREIFLHSLGWCAMLNIRKILLPVDFPNTSLHVIHQAATLAHHFHSEIVMLHVRDSA